MSHGPTAHGGGVRRSAGSTEDRIIRATLELVESRGLSSITMSAVAAGAGISRQTLYNHYPDVERIVVAAAERHNDDAIAMLESSMAVVSTPEERLEQLVRHVVGVAAHGGPSLDSRHSLAPSLRQGLAGHDDAIRDHIERIIEDGVASGVFRSDLDPGVDGPLLQATLVGAARLVGDHPGLASEVSNAGQRAVLAMLRG